MIFSECARALFRELDAVRDALGFSFWDFLNPPGAEAPMYKNWRSLANGFRWSMTGFAFGLAVQSTEQTEDACDDLSCGESTYITTNTGRFFGIGLFGQPVSMKVWKDNEGDCHWTYLFDPPEFSLRRPDYA